MIRLIDNQKTILSEESQGSYKLYFCNRILLFSILFLRYFSRPIQSDENIKIIDNFLLSL